MKMIFAGCRMRTAERTVDFVRRSGFYSIHAHVSMWISDGPPKMYHAEVYDMREEGSLHVESDQSVHQVDAQH